MKIGILGAMFEEVSAIKEMMNVEKETSIAGRVYYEGNIGDVEVVVTFSKWGKVASACTTTILINQFHVDFVLFSGVAGAVSTQVNIGDIIVGNGLYQHDMDARPFFDQFQIPLTDILVFEPAVNDVEKAAVSIQRFINRIDDVLEREILEQFSISRPKVYTGLIASGDAFISHPHKHSHLNLNYKGNQTLAVEMEGASVAQVCHDHGVPYTVIRVISDKADQEAVIDFELFVKEIASKYLAEIIKEYLQ